MVERPIVSSARETDRVQSSKEFRSIPLTSTPALVMESKIPHTFSRGLWRLMTTAESLFMNRPGGRRSDAGAQSLLRSALGRWKRTRESGPRGRRPARARRQPSLPSKERQPNPSRSPSLRREKPQSRERDRNRLAAQHTLCRESPIARLADDRAGSGTPRASRPLTTDRPAERRGRRVAKWTTRWRSYGSGAWRTRR